MKNQLVFKLENSPDGFENTFAPNCKVRIENQEGQLYLNYEKRAERIVGHFQNLRQEGEIILADVTLLTHVQLIENRLTYSIEGSVISKNETDEVTEIAIKGVSALMPNKF